MADEAKSYGRKKQLLTTFLSAWIQSNFHFYSKDFGSSIVYIVGSGVCKKIQEILSRISKKNIENFNLIYFNFN